TKHAVQAMVWCLREELKGTSIKASTINPGSVDTPWFDGKDVDRSKMLAVEDIAKAVRFIIDQDETSDIDHILLLPGKE
ncbi:MAG: short-chain dehydrogenase, partial [Candidatus Heimdallarchaeaceae archaeon]